MMNLALFLGLTTTALGLSWVEQDRRNCPFVEGFNTIEEYLLKYPNTNVHKLIATSGTKVPLSGAMNNFGATCLDGSVPVMYWRPGTGDGVNKFHVFFQGGGWCGGITTQLSQCQNTCADRATTNLGTSKDYPSSLNYDSGYMSTDQKTNPLTYNWNTIYVKYCDGGSFSGNNDTTVTSGNITLHFRGFRILNGVFQELNQKYNWGKKTTDVLISGCSAGGLTTWLHSDYIYNTYVKPFGITNFMAMPDSGFFLEYEGTGKYITALEWVYTWMNATASLNPGCISAHQKTNDEEKCIFAQETAPFVQVKMFPLQSRFDSWQTNCELSSSNVSEINKYGTQFTQDFETMYIKATHGIHNAFLDSCHHHCGEWNAIKINGVTSSQAQYAVYNQDNATFYFQNDKYPCNSCC